ncbi:leucine-rich repeat-containing protein 15-like [Anoplophora glabripennis]|uniref:leucine-rich repeat-containing protein 15-like n=1 Tax=Anoplophora glabripennis TaxID=217634 RepID=UPI00087403FE|nr:leucine-rich repeat-containing protein 15-like [Anoplophora glabripennis]
MNMFSRNTLVASVGFVLVLFSAAEDVKVLKKHTYYNTSLDEVVLMTVNLQEIELEAFKDISVYFIQIYDNPLEKLRKGIFVNVSIHEMMFFGNNITTIEPGTFHGLHPLEERGILLLSLSNNKLGNIKKGIFNNTKFRKLDLSTNRIKFIEPDSFDGMVDLFQLDLSVNFLEKIDVGVFQNLATPTGWVQLSLARNKIKFIDPYAFENTTLYTVDLQNNQLGSLTSHYFKRTSIGNFDV